MRASQSTVQPENAHREQRLKVGERAGEFDAIHNHAGWPLLRDAHGWQTPVITTLHGRLDIASEKAAYRRFPEQPFVSISDSQRQPLPGLRWMGTVYNGLDLDAYHFQSKPGNYLVFLGRICPEKRPDRAIRIAQSFGMPLILAAKIDPVDHEYYECVIRPLVRAARQVDFIGEVNDAEKDELLGKAYACLFPIDWPEPFGLTMIEAMATGTPVVAWREGSVPEVIVDGVTGFIGDSEEDLVEALATVSELDRSACRRHVEENFSAARMIDAYEDVYRALIPVEPETLLLSGILSRRKLRANDLPGL